MRANRKPKLTRLTPNGQGSLATGLPLRTLRAKLEHLAAALLLVN